MLDLSLRVGPLALRLALVDLRFAEEDEEPERDVDVPPASTERAELGPSVGFLIPRSHLDDPLPEDDEEGD